MKARVTLSTIMIFASVSLGFSQTVEKKKKINNPIKPSEQLLPDVVNKKITLENKSIRPFFYSLPPMSKNAPLLTDFYRTQQNLIYKPFSFVGKGEERTYTGIGKYISIQGAIRWQPARKLFIDAGGLFSRQFYYSSFLSRQNASGVNGRIQYTLANRVRLNIRGQYIFPESSFPHPVYNSLFPHTGAGASLSIDVNKDSDISVGAEYQFDSKSQKWKLESSGRVSIGF